MRACQGAIERDGKTLSARRAEHNQDGTIGAPLAWTRTLRFLGGPDNLRNLVKALNEAAEPDVVVVRKRAGGDGGGARDGGWIVVL